MTAGNGVAWQGEGTFRWDGNAWAPIGPWRQAPMKGGAEKSLSDRLRIGDPDGGGGCVLAVSEPRLPCQKFSAAMGFAQASRLMAQSGWCGAYLSVLEPGAVQAGDAIELVPGPREVNLRELFRKRAPAGSRS